MKIDESTANTTDFTKAGDWQIEQNHSIIHSSIYVAFFTADCVADRGIEVLSVTGLIVNWPNICN